MTYILLTVGLILNAMLVIFLLTKFSITKYPYIVKPTQEFCIQGYFFLPNHYNAISSIQARIVVRDKTTIFNRFDIFAKRICFKPTTLLPEESEYPVTMSYFGKLNMDILQKQISIKTGKYPEVRINSVEEGINQNEILRYETNYSTDLLDYDILHKENISNCTKEDLFLLCDLSTLKLEQGSTYELNLVAKYGDEVVDDVYTANVNILTPVTIGNSSIKDKEVIQNLSIPEIQISFNKEILKDFNVILEDGDKNQVKFETTLTGQQLSILPKENFKQSTTYYLKINGVTGTDGSNLENEYVLQFSTDDGPRITGTNIVSGFSTTGNIVLTFNQNLKTNQNIKSIIKFNTGSEYSYTISKNKITINPTNSFNSCKSYTLNIGKGVLSNTGFVSSKSYTYTLKTACRRVASIGTSVKGRPIYASYFGTGSKKIVFFASMHGSESNTKTTLDRWIAELELNSNNIPTDKTIIVIPTVNPDGVANRSRFNANGVDLNRNFETPTWVTGTYLQNEFYPTGGGPNPFSEPESVLIRSLVSRENPYLTLSYHSAAGYTIPSNTNNGVTLGKIYSQLSGYKYIVPGTEGSFKYDITGTFEEWAEIHGYSSIVVELSSGYSDQFIQNKAAMWEMVKR